MADEVAAASESNRHVRDYSLLGADGQAAVAAGLVGATWYVPPISRKKLGELMKRRNGPAIRDTLIWLSALSLSATAAVVLWGSWWAVAPFAVYGILYGSV